MKKVVVRERMDFGPPPPPLYKDDPESVRAVVAATKSWSIMHKAWDDGTAEYYFIGKAAAASAHEAWDAFVAAGQLPQPVGENSEWGDGLPAPERDAYFGSRK